MAKATGKGEERIQIQKQQSDESRLSSELVRALQQHMMFYVPCCVDRAIFNSIFMKQQPDIFHAPPSCSTAEKEGGIGAVGRNQNSRVWPYPLSVRPEQNASKQYEKGDRAVGIDVQSWAGADMFRVDQRAGSTFSLKPAASHEKSQLVARRDKTT